MQDCLPPIIFGEAVFYDLLQRRGTLNSERLSLFNCMNVLLRSLRFLSSSHFWHGLMAQTFCDLGLSDRVLPLLLHLRPTLLLQLLSPLVSLLLCCCKHLPAEYSKIVLLCGLLIPANGVSELDRRENMLPSSSIAEVLRKVRILLVLPLLIEMLLQSEAILILQKQLCILTM